MSAKTHIHLIMLAPTGIRTATTSSNWGPGLRRDAMLYDWLVVQAEAGIQSHLVASPGSGSPVPGLGRLAGYPGRAAKKPRPNS
jgi:hypothetical protein